MVDWVEGRVWELKGGGVRLVRREVELVVVIGESKR